MSYLIAKDFNKQIQTDNLNQVIGSDSSVLSSAEATAVEEAVSYLVQKYEMTGELKDTTKWDKTVVYKAGQRVYLDAPAYVNATAYLAGDYVTYSGNEYKCTAPTTGTFDPTKWTLVSPQYQIFYATTPYPVFDLNGQYIKGDHVFWNDKTYTCLIATSAPDHSSQLQYGSISGVPFINTFPDDLVSGKSYWGTGVVYNIPAPTDILDVKWAIGDNRSQQLVTYLIDITLYHVHSRIAPRNIPDLRVKRYDDAIKWLKAAGKGDITAALPMLQPRSGGRIRYGGNVKNQNSY